MEETPLPPSRVGVGVLALLSTKVMSPSSFLHLPASLSCPGGASLHGSAFQPSPGATARKGCSTDCGCGGVFLFEDEICFSLLLKMGLDISKELRV